MSQELELEALEINDPSLLLAAPDDFVQDAVVEFIKLPPPSDGVHQVVLKLSERKEVPVYVKGDRDPSSGALYNKRVVASIAARVLSENGAEGAFLKDFYPTSAVNKGQKTSNLASLCFLNGTPLPTGPTIEAQIEHVKRIFAEAGENGIVLWAKTRWIKAVPKIDDNGMPVYQDGTEWKEYTEIRSEKAVRRHALLSAQLEVASWQAETGESQEDFDNKKREYVQYWGVDYPHMFEDPLDGQIRYVQCEIQELVRPPKEKK
jgi:hypothetical protein